MSSPRFFTEKISPDETIKKGNSSSASTKRKKEARAEYKIDKYYYELSYQFCEVDEVATPVRHARKKHFITLNDKEIQVFAGQDIKRRAFYYHDGTLVDRADYSKISEPHHQQYFLNGQQIYRYARFMQLKKRRCLEESDKENAIPVSHAVKKTKKPVYMYQNEKGENCTVPEETPVQTFPKSNRHFIELEGKKIRVYLQYTFLSKRIFVDENNNIIAKQNEVKQKGGKYFYQGQRVYRRGTLQQHLLTERKFNTELTAALAKDIPVVDQTSDVNRLGKPIEKFSEEIVVEKEILPQAIATPDMPSMNEKHHEEQVDLMSFLNELYDGMPNSCVEDGACFNEFNEFYNDKTFTSGNEKQSSALSYTAAKERTLFGAQDDYSDKFSQPPDEQFLKKY